LVYAIVVAFHPDPDRFSSAISVLSAQVDSVIVVDNGGDAIASGHKVLRLDSNVGVGAAQNAGIRAALEAGATHVLLLDHDSIPAEGMVTRLLAALSGRVAAAGPVWEADGAESRFIRFGRLGFERVRCGEADAVMDVDFLIASGTLIRADALLDIGQMDESLFIDHVDTDWCLRARAKGWRLAGVCGARMSHRLGERTFHLAGVPFHSHGPDRCYFTFRNSLLLYRRPHATARWIRADAMRLLKLAAATALFGRPRLASLAAAGRGFADGMREWSGPASERA
jgi:rhamnosyltransferase